MRRLQTPPTLPAPWPCSCPLHAARYFHPPGEILLASALGMVMFQGPLLIYAVRAIQLHHREHAAAVEAAAAAPKHRRHRRD